MIGDIVAHTTAVQKRPKRLDRAASVPRETAVEVSRRILAGFPFKALETLCEDFGTPMEQIATWARISPRTLARRRAQSTLSVEESERVYRLSRVLHRVTDFFDGDHIAAMRWLSKARPVFGDQSALEFSKTEIGADEVLDLIGRLEHGVYS